MTDIIIFGTARRGSETYAILSQLPEYRVIAFSCSNKVEWGSKKESIPIISPDDIPKQYENAVVVIASVPYYTEIKTELLAKNLVLPDRCLDSVYEIIGSLSKEERSILKSRLNGKTTLYNLDYEKIDIPLVQKTEDKYLIICGSDYLKCMFVHDRAVEYKNAGLKVEVFSFIRDSSFEHFDYDGTHVFQGDIMELKRLLLRCRYKKFLIHFANEEIMYAISQAGRAATPMIVWCHGCEVLPWHYYWIDYSEEEIASNIKQWDKRDDRKRLLFQNCFRAKNIHFVFVSEWMKHCTVKSIGERPRNYSIIHNFINSSVFTCDDKEEADRLHILMIKSHATKKYSADLAAAAILRLSKEAFFSDLTFDLYGDGILFESNFGALMEKNFPNVHIHKEFVNHQAMRELFRENGIFLSPTRLDAQGVTANEAMAAGLAVISCNTAAIPEFMDEDCASLYEYDNYWMLADEIEYLYFHPEEFLRKSKNAVQRIKSQCGYDQTIKREMQLITGT